MSLFQGREVKWWLSIVNDLLLYLSILFCYFSLPLPFYGVTSQSYVYGWQTPRIWGWTFPHAAFFFCFILQKNAPETLLRLYLFSEIFFGIMFITVSPTITMQALIGESDLSGTYISIFRGTGLLFSAYILGAAAVLLHLFTTIRAIEDDRIGEHSFGVNITSPYLIQTQSLGGYQTLSDPTVNPNQHYYQNQPTYQNQQNNYPPQNYQNTTQNTQPPPVYSSLSSASHSSSSTTQHQQNYPQTTTTTTNTTNTTPYGTSPYGTSPYGTSPSYQSSPPSKDEYVL